MELMREKERSKGRRAKKYLDVRTKRVSSAPLDHGGICWRPARGKLGTGHFRKGLNIVQFFKNDTGIHKTLGLLIPLPH